MNEEDLNQIDQFDDVYDNDLGNELYEPESEE